MKRRGGECLLLDEHGRKLDEDTRPDQTLIRALRNAHRLLADHTDQPLGQIDPSSWAQSPKSYYDRNLCRLAFLAPDIQAAILEGRQPRDLTLAQLMEPGMPIEWAQQRSRFGLGGLDDGCHQRRGRPHLFDKRSTPFRSP